jgi:hypothetical protein
MVGSSLAISRRDDAHKLRAIHASTFTHTHGSGKDYDFRWMQVWVRVGGDWQLAASQATRLPMTS